VEEEARMVDQRLEDALRAVRLYYLQDVTMDAIAAELHTSRSTVSRLLTYAREKGLVEFQVNNPSEASPQLERDVSTHFGIRTHVVPGNKDASELETLENVAKYAARIFNSLFGSDMVLGVAWGTTVTAVSRHLVPKPTRNSRIVQLNGAGNNHSSGIEYASEILGRFGRAFDAPVDQFPVPTFFDSPATKRALWKERSIQRVLALQQRADVAIFGIGALGGQVPSHVYRGGYLEPSERKALVATGAVGDVATVFVRQDGSYRDIPLNARSSGLGLDQLARVRTKLCVAVGAHRVPGLHGAIAAGLVSHLVIDEKTAANLLAISR
jgi:deoxyribonucleoside regulator